MSDSLRKAIHTDQAPKAIGPYSQAMEVDGWVYCSGQIPIVPEDGSIAHGIENQAHQALKNLGEVLKAAGCGFEDVERVSIFVDREDTELIACHIWDKESQTKHTEMFNSILTYWKLVKNYEPKKI